MIDIDDAAIVHRLDTGDGRYLLFHRADPAKASMLPWSGVILDLGGDGHGLQVFLKPDGESWSICDLLRVAIARALAEEDRRLTPLIFDILQHLGLALRAEYRRIGVEPPDHLRYGPGVVPSPYPWTVAIHGHHHLPLCPDPESRDEGATPEQIMLVVAQAFADAKVAMDQRCWATIAHQHVQLALVAERRRVQRLRQHP